MNKLNFNSKYKINYNNFFSMVEEIGPDLNDRKNRFDKADLLESAVEANSAKRLMWVDQLGYDHIDIDGIKFECKSQANCIYTKNGKLKEKTATLKLTNTLQKSINKKLEATADYLLIIDTGSDKSYSMGIISYKEVVSKYAKQLPDGFSCQIPMHKLTLLIDPKNVKIKKLLNSISYSEEKKRLQREFVLRHAKGVV